MGKPDPVDGAGSPPAVAGHRGARHASAPLRVRLYTFQAHRSARRFYERHGFVAIELTDGSGNEERIPDVLYEHRGSPRDAC